MQSCINYEYPLNNPKHVHAAKRNLTSQKESLCWYRLWSFNIYSYSWRWCIVLFIPQSGKQYQLWYIQRTIYVTALVGGGSFICTIWGTDRTQLQRYHTLHQLSLCSCVRTSAQWIYSRRKTCWKKLKLINVIIMP